MSIYSVELHSMAKYFQGLFKPINPQKYKGNPTQICFRSSYELKLLTYLDRHPEIVWYSSEELSIPYRSPIDRSLRRYYPDILCKRRNDILMIEVKPKFQRNPPVLAEGKRMTASHKRAVITYAINDAKWKAARAYCEDRGWIFKIMTEKELGIT